MFRRIRNRLVMAFLNATIADIEAFDDGQRQGIKVNLTDFGKWLCGGEPEREPTEDEIMAARINAAVAEGHKHDPEKCDCGDTHGRPKAKA